MLLWNKWGIFSRYVGKFPTCRTCLPPCLLRFLMDYFLFTESGASYHLPMPISHINQPSVIIMKPILYLILSSLLLTGCLKANVAPTTKADSAAHSNINITQAITTRVGTVDNYDWYNGTKGSALIQVTCNDCTAIATIGDVTTPFLFNTQGVGQLKYTPAPGLSVYIAVCPGSTKTINAEIFDTSNILLYNYTGVSGNWNNTYVIK